jgi:hypothetical protein
MKTTEEPPLMVCGCVANAKVFMPDGSTKPACAIHNCSEVATNKPSLEGRVAQCTCGNTAASSYSLPFFKYNKQGKQDSYYCGCWGWD